MKTKALLAKRTKTLTNTAVIEVLKAAADPTIISFAGGVPAPATFPIEKLKKAAVSVLEKYGEKSLQYQPTQGVAQFLETLSVYLSKKWNKKIKPENILVASGSQQAIDLLGKTFINPGDAVVVERPSYFVALQAFSAYNPKFVEINFANNRLDLIKLEKVLKKERPKLVYLNPSFQNPTGQSLAKQQRLEIAKFVKKYPKTLFLEDTAYTDLYFEKAYADIIKFSSKIIHLGTFSKILSPGLRLGYIVGPKDIIYNLTLVKQSADLHTNSLSQLIVNEILSDKRWFKKHLKKIRSSYKNQAKSMDKVLAKNMPDGVLWNKSKGGLFFWLKTKANTKNLYPKAIKQKIAFVPGHVFFAKRPKYNFMRLSFATTSEKEMEKGIKKLARLLTKGPTS